MPSLFAYETTPCELLHKWVDPSEDIPSMLRIMNSNGEKVTVETLAAYIHKRNTIANVSQIKLSGVERERQIEAAVKAEVPYAIALEEYRLKRELTLEEQQTIRDQVLQEQNQRTEFTVAVLLYSLEREGLHLSYIGVDPRHRRKGFARALLNKLKSRLDPTRRRFLWASVSSDDVYGWGTLLAAKFVETSREKLSGTHEELIHLRFDSAKPNLAKITERDVYLEKVRNEFEEASIWIQRIKDREGWIETIRGTNQSRVLQARLEEYMRGFEDKNMDPKLIENLQSFNAELSRMPSAQSTVADQDRGPVGYVTRPAIELFDNIVKHFKATGQVENP